MKKHIVISLKPIVVLGLFLMVFGIKASAQAPSISYTVVHITFTVGAGITTLTPSNSGGTPAINGQTSTFAGTGSAGFVNGTGTGASFNQPHPGQRVDASGNIYISDVGNEVIRKITPAGVVTTYAGTGTPGSTNGIGTSAAFYHPVQLCVDNAGNMYVADEKDNNMIRKIVLSTGVVTTLAGQTTAGFTNATGTSAQFNLPCGVAVDGAGNVYVADYNNNVIRKITSAGVVTTFAGSGSVGSANGTGTAATFNHPYSLAIDASGNLYVADRLNFMIRMITPVGVVTTLAGQTTAGFANGYRYGSTI